MNCIYCRSTFIQEADLTQLGSPFGDTFIEFIEYFCIDCQEYFYRYEGTLLSTNDKAEKHKTRENYE